MRRVAMVVSVLALGALGVPSVRAATPGATAMAPIARLRSTSRTDATVAAGLALLDRVGPSLRAASASASPLARPATSRPRASAGRAASGTDPVGDTVDQHGAMTVEPRDDITAFSISAGATLEVQVTVPGGTDPAADPSWQSPFTGLAVAFDVNGDDKADFGAFYKAAPDGSVVVAAVPTGYRGPLCPGTGRYDPAGRTYSLSVPTRCFGPAVRYRAQVGLLFDRMPGMNPPLLSLDVAPNGPVPAEVLRATHRDGDGYRLVATDGGVFAFGDASFAGSTGAIHLNKAILGATSTPSGDGYWLVASDGGVFAFGDAPFAGSTGAITLNMPIVAMAATSTGRGYWLVASDGGVFAFGDAPFLGSAGGRPLDQPIVAMAATPDGAGYWLVGRDGKVLTFGDATYAGATGGTGGQPFVGIAPTTTGAGYWLARADGEVVAFGDAVFDGDAASIHLSRPVVGIAATPTGQGYWLTATDGGIFTFGDAGYFGSTGAIQLNRPVVGIAS